MFTDDFDKPFRIFIVFSYIVVAVLLISLIIIAYNDVKFKNKVMTEYDKCININEDLYCKVK